MDLERLQAARERASSSQEDQDETFFDGAVRGRLGVLEACLCMSKHWTITSSGADIRPGCGSGAAKSFELRQIRDMSYQHGGCLQLCLGKGTITFLVAGDDGEHTFRMTVAGAEPLYHAVRKAWHDAKLAAMAAGKTSK